MEQAPPGGPQTGQKTYVFVDEYNRHKRLKVMRACDGCRKRKIRCDGALQNGPWPCGACVRLKLKCIPPTVDPEDELPTPDSATGPGQMVFSAASASIPGTSRTTPMPNLNQSWSGAAPSIKPEPSPIPLQKVESRTYDPQLFNPQVPRMVDHGYPEDEYLASYNTAAQYQTQRPSLPPYIRTHTDTSNQASDNPQEVDATVRELSEHMGELAIDLSSAAPYITNEKRKMAETPAMEEADVLLPPSVSTDLTVRIPREMMPSEERAMDYFGYFFEYVHPYVPVLNRQAFYEQWRVARHSISPLILEGVFACVARYLEQPIEVRKWLALASRHEESFKDVPRITTIQALIILTKAREFVPKRGYYYRSWMAVKYMTTMAFDLGLHEHLDKHRAGQGCGLSMNDCIVRTRMWQTLFGLEIWVGAPQGRTDFAVENETVDFTLATSSADPDAFERRASRRITFLAQAVHNIKQTNVFWQRMRRHSPEWSLDDAFTSQNQVIDDWFTNLPPDMSLQYTDDDTPPYLHGDHFVANLHVYHHLIVIMQHRPQLQTLLEKRDPAFKVHLEKCTQAASLMCRVHEAIYRDFGLHGLQFMQRGIGFTIYCVLTCIMMLLASITSPDPVVNSRARNFFTRHMRILELCAPSASQEVQAQINALREAFSQDTSKPFEIKASLGVRSPSTDSYPTPVTAHASLGPSLSATPSWPVMQEQRPAQTMTPANDYAPAYDTSTVAQPIPYTTMAVHTQPSFAPVSSATIQQPTPQHSQHQQHNYPVDSTSLTPDQQPVWDPSGIFQQWNTAFGPPAVAQTSSALNATTNHLPIVPDQAPIYHPSQQSPPGGGSTVVPPTMPPPQQTAAVVPTVTPMMWQDAFTNAYVSGHGHKRVREESGDFGTGGGSSVKRRG